MKAICYHGPQDVRFDTVPDAEIQESTDVVVEVKRCGICGSDLHIYHGEVGQVSCGSSIGHEAVGEVVEIGAAVTNVRVGAQVVLPALLSCGACEACRQGMLNRCANGPAKGFGFGLGLGGCQADALRVPNARDNVRHIPEGVSLDQALMLTDNLPTAYAACARADIPMGGDVAVVGLGCIGLLAVECAFLLGAARVFAIDPVAARRDYARTLGAITFDPSTAVDDIRDLTSGRMADSVIEAVGFKHTVNLAFNLVGKMRTVSLAGSGQAVTEKGSAIGVDIPLEAFYFGTTLRVMPVTEVTRYWEDLIPHIQSGRLRPEKLITDTLPLSEGSEAYRRFDAKEGGIMKVVLTP